ncbi:allantoinase AllB [Mumia sp. Pv 4-285]|uniref:allantoinase AllB n=1 Tax=Mumia qirimensis TaxID=3234852 RepID=UPI00351D3A7A
MGRSALSAANALVDGELRPATITITDGTITAVTLGASGDDAGAGAYVLPGVVDTHVHVNEPGRTAWEGFATATEAAARGGVTTIVDMPLNSVPATTTPEALALKRSRAEGQVRVDTGFWGGAVPDNLGSLEGLWDEGVLGFKCFLIDSGVADFPPLGRDQLHAAMREIGGFDGLLIVHAEDPDVIASSPAPPSRAYADFVSSRPDEAEVAAIARVVDAVREHGTRTHLVHLSSARALGLIADARAEGLPLTVETCPHYLVLDAGSVPDGATEFKCCPPIRDRGNQDALWDALVDGVIDCVVSDHSPSTAAEKSRGGGDLQQAWGGITGLQVGFAAVADSAVRRGVGIERVSAWMSTTPARIAGVAGKGAIAAGYDADFVLWSPTDSYEVHAEALAHRNKPTPYAGLTLQGRVTRTVLRGETVFDATTDAVPATATGRLLRR